LAARLNLIAATSWACSVLRLLTSVVTRRNSIEFADGIGFAPFIRALLLSSNTQSQDCKQVKNASAVVACLLPRS